MEDRLFKSKQAIASALELPEDVILNRPKITVTGDNEVIIENHKGVVIFGEKMVKVNSGIGLITINGTGFEILFMGGSTINIGGRFESLIYEGNE